MELKMTSQAAETTEMSAAAAPAGSLTQLVGSVPLDSAEAVFRAAATELGPRIRRIPDGETGKRSGWVGFQIPLLAAHPAFERLPSGPDGSSGADLDKVARAEGEDYSMPVFALRPGIRAEDIEFGDLGYASAAIGSYATFVQLRDAGVIAPGIRFQVSLPTPLALLLLFVNPPDQLTVEPAYKAALLRELDHIRAAVPASDLAVQWDIAPEVALFERAWESVFDDVEGELTRRFIELGNAVPLPVQLGYHLCYGDFGHQHFLEPSDLSVAARITGGVIAGLRRRLDWVHMPAPRSRDDEAYFAPLSHLRLPADTELFLGLIHATDGIDGARRRITAAQRSAPAFGVATECGFGRRDPRSVPALLGLHRAAADYLAGTLGWRPAS
jgi:hypothetical protein